MRKQEDLKQELEELSPLLSKLKAQDNPFKTPEGYFSSLPDELMARLRMEAQPRPVNVPARPRWIERLSEFLAALMQPRLAVSVAVVAVLVVTGLIWLRPESAAEPAGVQTPLLAQLSAEEVSDYVTENIETFEEDELLVAVTESGIEVENTLPAIDLSAEDVEKYMEEAIQEMDEEDLESLF